MGGAMGKNTPPPTQCRTASYQIRRFYPARFRQLSILR